MDHRTELFTRYVCLQLHSYGIGDTLKAAKQNCRQAGGMGKRIDYMIIATIPFVKIGGDFQVGTAGVSVAELDGAVCTTNCKCIEIK